MHDQSETDATISRSRFQRITSRALGDGWTPGKLAEILDLNPRTAERLGRPSHPIRVEMLEGFAQAARAKGLNTLAGAYESEITRALDPARDRR